MAYIENLPSCLSQKQRFRASRRRLLFHWVRLRFGGGGPWWPSAAGYSPSHARPLLVATTGRCGPFRRCAGVGARQPGDTRVSIRVHVLTASGHVSGRLVHSKRGRGRESGRGAGNLLIWDWFGFTPTTRVRSHGHFGRIASHAKGGAARRATSLWDPRTGAARWLNPFPVHPHDSSVPAAAKFDGGEESVKGHATTGGRSELARYR